MSEKSNCLSIDPAQPHEVSILDDLMQHYLFELSEFSHQTKNTQGHYSYPYLKHYWQDPNRHPYLFRYQGAVVGFALVRRDNDPVDGSAFVDLAEFFIIEQNRRESLGRQAAQAIWDLYPTQWQIRILKNNTAAKLFWASVVDEYTGGKFEKFDRLSEYSYSFSVKS